MKITKTISKKIGNARTAAIQKIHDQTGRLLTTTKAQRKAQRKANREQRRKEGKTIRSSVSQWKPFGFIAKRPVDRIPDLGDSNPAKDLP